MYYDLKVGEGGKLVHLYIKNGEGNGTPLQYSCLENPMDGGARWAAVHEVTKSQTRLSDFTFTFHFHALEKEMATHSSVLAWRIPGTAEPGGLPSMESHRVGHDWSDLAAAAAVHKENVQEFSKGRAETGKWKKYKREETLKSKIPVKYFSSKGLEMLPGFFFLSVHSAATLSCFQSVVDLPSHV